MNKKILNIAFLIILPIQGCSKYRIQIDTKNPKIPLFIAIPINDSSEYPLSQELFASLSSCYKKNGYKLTNKNSYGYTLKTMIESVTPTQYFISRDVVLLHKLIAIKVTCSLFNFNNINIAEKIFTFEIIISKAQSPLQQDLYTTHMLRDMLERRVTVIEQFFRKYLQ